MDSPKQKPQKSPDPFAVLADLFRAAEEDAELRRQIESLLRLSSLQRQSLLNTSIHEMTLRGEPADVLAAFQILSTDEGAAAARRLLGPSDDSA